MNPSTPTPPVQSHFLTKPQVPCADPAPQPESPTATPSKAQEPGLPRTPTFHISFPRANPPQKPVTAQPAEPTPRLCPLPEADSCWIPRALGSARSPGGAHSLRNTGAEHYIHLHLQGHKSVLAEMEVLPPILLGTEESPNEKTDLLLFHVKTEPTWGMGEIKKGCISIATVSYDNIEA